MKNRNPTPMPDRPPAPMATQLVAVQVLEAVSDDIAGLRRRLQECERWVSKITGILEGIFREELARRLDGDKADGIAGYSVPALERLRMQASQEKVAANRDYLR